MKTIILFLCAALLCVAFVCAEQGKATQHQATQHFEAADISLAAPQDPWTATISVEAPQTGRGALEKQDARFEPPKQFRGQIAYGWDTGPIFFSGGGNEPPWQSYLTVHSLLPSDVALPVVTYPVSIPDDLFVFGPQFSPDGTKILFKVGDYVSEYVMFRPMLFERKTKKLTEIESPHQSIGNQNLRWSPDSRYVAYLRHGFALPFGGKDDTAQLHLYDTITRKDQQVVENDGVVDSFCWMNEGLLYSVFPAGGPPSRPPADLFAFSTVTGKSTLLRHDAYRPVSSPDGKKIAFISVSDPRASAKEKQGNKKPFHFTYDYAVNKYLTLWSPENRTTRVIRQEHFAKFSELRWQPSSRGLVIVNRQRLSESQMRAEISTYNLETDRVEHTIKISYADYESMDEYEALFLPLSVSKDNKWLFYRVDQPFLATPTDHGQYLRAVRLSDGLVSTLCFVPGYNGMDWREQSQMGN